MIDADVRGTPSADAANQLEARERVVLGQLASGMDTWVSFQGLRRQLGLHQQVLSRTLRRLEAEGLVAREGRGYALTEAGAALLEGHAPLSLAPAPAAPGLAVLEALLPPHVGAAEVSAHLARRWFQGLRWHGVSEAPGETLLQWSTAVGAGRLLLRVSGGTVAVEVQGDHDAATFALLRPLLAALSELYTLPGPMDPFAGYRGATGANA